MTPVIPHTKLATINASLTWSLPPPPAVPLHHDDGDESLEFMAFGNAEPDEVEDPGDELFPMKKDIISGEGGEFWKTRPWSDGRSSLADVNSPVSMKPIITGVKVSIVANWLNLTILKETVKRRSVLNLKLELKKEL